MSEIQRAKELAKKLFLESERIVGFHARNEKWLQEGKHYLDSSRSIADFVKVYIEADQAVNAVASRLIDAKRDDSIIKFGRWFDCLAHRLAVLYANAIYMELCYLLCSSDDGIEFPAPDPSVFEAAIRNGDYSELIHERRRNIQETLICYRFKEPTAMLTERIELEAIRAESSDQFVGIAKGELREKLGLSETAFRTWLENHASDVRLPLKKGKPNRYAKFIKVRKSLLESLKV